MSLETCYTTATQALMQKSPHLLEVGAQRDKRMRRIIKLWR